MRASLMLADSAQAVGGKLYVLGGGWNIAVPGPSAIAGLIQVDWNETNQRHHWVLELLDGDGEPVVLPGPFGEQPVRLEADFEIGRPPGVTAGIEQGVPFGINLGPLPLSPGRYVWRLSINGATDDDWRQPFSIVEALPGQPPPPEPPVPPAESA
jgi:hypothetical protein